MMAAKVDTEEKTAQHKLASLKPLIEKFRAQQAAGYETLEEIMLVMGGGITRAKQYERIETTFRDLWSARYGNTKYSFDYKVDRPQMLRLLKMMPIEEIEARMARYLRNSDPFFSKCRHTFPILVKTINQHAIEQPTGALDLNADESSPIGCQHSPTCKTDSEHTKRINEDRRREFQSF
jgi:hypothetical protein